NLSKGEDGRQATEVRAITLPFETDGTRDLDVRGKGHQGLGNCFRTLLNNSYCPCHVPTSGWNLALQENVLHHLWGALLKGLLPEVEIMFPLTC
ncbi:hypothetical protein P7K49_025062, partial [Saguinus oedipus]